MAKKFLTNLDLTKNQILNVALQNLGTPPGSPVSGQIYFNTTDARIYFWDGTAWVDISGDLRSVIGGSGLTATYSADGDEVTLVTLGKIQQIASLKVLANVTGSTADVQAVDIKTAVDGTASDTNMPTTKAVKDYVDANVASLGNLEGGWDASSGSFPVGSSPTAGTKAGDYWYVTVAGTVDSEAFAVGDVVVAKVNAASTSLKSDWIRLEVNRDQATESVLGLVEIATQTETNTGTNDTAAVTPLKLAGRTATETRTGIAEIATQAETDAGLDDERIVTPYKLVTYITNRTGGYAANVGNGSATSFALTHGLNAADVLVAIYDNSTKEEVFADVYVTSSSVVTVSFATAPASNAYRVVIKK